MKKLYKSSRFCLAVHMYSNNAQRMSKHGRNISCATDCGSQQSFAMFFVHYQSTHPGPYGIFLLNYVTFNY